MKIAIIGESLGNWQNLHDAIEIATTFGATAFIQVGNFGFSDKELKTYKIPVKVFTGGGFDDNLPQTLVKEKPQEVAGNPSKSLWFCPPGTTLEIPETLKDKSGVETTAKTIVMIFGGTKDLKTDKQETIASFRETYKHEKDPRPDLLITAMPPLSIKRYTEEELILTELQEECARSMQDLGDALKPWCWAVTGIQKTIGVEGYRKYCDHLISLGKNSEFTIFDTKSKRFTYYQI